MGGAVSRQGRPRLVDDPQLRCRHQFRAGQDGQLVVERARAAGGETSIAVAVGTFQVFGGVIAGPPSLGGDGRPRGDDHRRQVAHAIHTEQARRRAVDHNGIGQGVSEIVGHRVPQALSALVPGVIQAQDSER